MNLIDEKTTKEEHLKSYESYPQTFVGGLKENPFYESRILPIYYEIPIGAKVLDIGCNNGEFMLMLRDGRKCDVKGIDLSETALTVARERGLDVCNVDAENLPFEDESFDVVCLMELLSHVLDPRKVLSEARRVLKSSGFLLGSCPHKTLESHIWDDKRLHRRYYNESELYDDLRNSFDVVYLKTLRGGQFSVGMASSFLAKEPVEMLFKCGGKLTKVWEEALLDKSTVRVYMGFTQYPGDVYYRMSGYANKMRKLSRIEVAYQEYDQRNPNSCGHWQDQVSPSSEHKGQAKSPIAVNQLGQLVKVADVSIWQITALKGVIAFFRLIKDVFKKPFITEMDDWIFDIPSYNIAAHPYKPNSDAEWCAMKQIELSDMVICSTEFIREQLIKLYPGKRVFVLRNSLDFDIWDKLEFPRIVHEKNPDLIRISFTGCANHEGDLAIVKKPLEVLMEEFPNVEFIGPSFTVLKDLKRYEKREWVDLNSYPQEYASWETDIAIAPLKDSYFNRSKSNLRWLESSAIGVPMVASDVYPFYHSIQNGEDGVLVENNAKSWYEALKGLILDKEKRQRIGEASYLKVRQRYSMDDVAKEYAEILKGVKDEFDTDSK